MAEALLRGLEPQVDAKARVLLLGSMPGAASLHQAQYYAHPRNRFWPLMAAVCGVDMQWEYSQRIAGLQQAGIGLWDVIGQCRRRGSLDTAIVRGSEVVNPLPQLMGTLPHLRVIACNGAAAHAAFRRWVRPQLPPALAGLPLLALPSTSPANAAWSLPRLLEQWRQLQPWLVDAEQGAGRPWPGGTAGQAPGQ